MPINRRNRKFPGEVDPPPTEDETVFTEVPSTSRSEVDPILQTEETEGHEDIEPPSHSVEKVRKKFKLKISRLETRPFWTWSEVKEGMMVYLKYYGFWHAVLVTQVIENLSKIRGIHYAVGRTIFHSRVVKEDDFVVNLDRNELWEVRIPEVVRRPIPETIELAHGLIGGETCCPDSWLPYRGSCYLFHDSERVDWKEAFAFCSQINSDLAIIENDNENKFVKYFARKLTDRSDQNITIFWLGASDSDIEGVWKWVAIDEELTYSDWDVFNNQPDRDPDNHEDCLALNGVYNFGWHDGLCRERAGFPLCEKKGSGSTGNGGGLQVIG